MIIFTFALSIRHKTSTPQTKYFNTLSQSLPPFLFSLYPFTKALHVF